MDKSDPEKNFQQTSHRNKLLSLRVRLRLRFGFIVMISVPPIIQTCLFQGSLFPGSARKTVVGREIEGREL